MSSPAPINSPKNPHADWTTIDYDYSSPLNPDGSNFPCKGYENTAVQSVADYNAGETYTATLSGSATHTGGSCQFALSYDSGKTFKVIKSIIGGCPLEGEYNFTIPSSAPSGDALFAWTWMNKKGNREFYMDCAWVHVEGEGGIDTTEEPLGELPNIFVANLKGINDCEIIEDEEPVFAPEIRGPDVEYGNGLNDDSPVNTEQKCTVPLVEYSSDRTVSQSYKHTDHSDETDSGTIEDDHHDHEDMHVGHDEARSDTKPMIMAPGAASASPSAVDLRMFEAPYYSGPASESSISQIRPIAIGDPHPIALAGYDLFYTDPPINDDEDKEEDTYVTVDVTVPCPSEDAVVVTVTASCTSVPDVTITVIGETVTVGLTKSSSRSSTRKTVTPRRSTLYSTITLSDPIMTSTPKWTTRISPSSSNKRPSASPSSSPSPRPPPGEGLAYATDPSLYMPCVPGSFLCTSAKQFLTCDQTALEGGGYGWTWLYARPIADGMECKPELKGGVGKGQQKAVPGGWHREDQYVRAG